jgi:hypothetical protein
MRLFFKFVSIIVLITVTLLFTGLSATASAASFERSDKLCCDECNKDENQSPANCSTPDCPHFLCLSIDMASPFTLSISTENVYIPKFEEELFLKLIPKPIFHPPTLV